MFGGGASCSNRWWAADPMLRLKRGYGGRPSTSSQDPTSLTSSETRAITSPALSRTQPLYLHSHTHLQAELQSPQSLHQRTTAEKEAFSAPQGLLNAAFNPAPVDFDHFEMRLVHMVQTLHFMTL